MNIHKETIDAYFAFKAAVHDIFGYNPNWVEIPLEDNRGMSWMLTNGEGYNSRCVWSPDPLNGESIKAGTHIYSGPIYTQRFLEKWVWRSEAYTLVAVDTQTDGNKFLLIFESRLECTDTELRACASVSH